GARLRGALLIEELGGNAIRVAHQDIGPPARGAKRTVRDGEIVAREIQLGVAGLREQHLPRVRDGHLAAVDGEELMLALGGHAGGSYYAIRAWWKQAKMNRMLLLWDEPAAAA